MSVDEALALFGLSRQVSLDDVKKAYRLAMKECHPDLHPNDQEKHERAKQLNIAMEVLEGKRQERRVVRPQRVVVYCYTSGYGGFTSNTTTTVTWW